MAISINGVVSGLDTDNIVAGLLDIQQQQLDRMAFRRTEIQQRQTAFKTLEMRLLGLRTDAGILARNTNNPVTRLIVTSGNPEAVSATASASAVPGVYRFRVDTLAQSHQVASQGFADRDAEITQGTFEIRLGSGEIRTITVDGSNNNLAAFAAAINSSGAGISASIVKDTSGGAEPWRLLLSGTKTGAANAISITNNLGDSADGAVRAVFDMENPVEQAADAVITIGAGAGAISVSSSTSQFSNVFAGMTFDLMKVNAGDNVSLTVTADSNGAVTAVENFVKSFNDVVDFIGENSKYDPASNQGGIFLGNQSAARVQNSLRSAVQAVVAGANPRANRLSAIGITFDDRGRLVVNRGRLQEIFNGTVEGVTANDVRRLFSLTGESDNPGISFVLGSNRTQTSATGYGVDVTQAAERASLTADMAPAPSTVIDSSNRLLELTLDGRTATVSLTEGTYTAQELADHLESVINSSLDFPGRQVSVAISGDRLQITSAAYGSASTLTIAGGSSLSALGFTAGQSDTGRDVAGSFIVNGNTESATGRGRILSGNPGNNNTADLQVSISLTQSQVIAGSEGTVTVSRGLASSLDLVLGRFLDSEKGLMSAVGSGFNAQLDSIQKSIDRQKTIFDLQEASIRKQFQALETAISQMNATSSYLGAQLANLPRMTTPSR